MPPHRVRAVEPEDSVVLDLDQLLRHAVERVVSDVHIKVGSPAVRARRRSTSIAPNTRCHRPRPTVSRSRHPQAARGGVTAAPDSDFAYSVSKLGGFRVNVFRQRKISSDSSSDACRSDSRRSKTRLAAGREEAHRAPAWADPVDRPDRFR